MVSTLGQVLRVMTDLYSGEMCYENTRLDGRWYTASTWGLSGLRLRCALLAVPVVKRVKEGAGGGSWEEEVTGKGVNPVDRG